MKELPFCPDSLSQLCCKIQYFFDFMYAWEEELEKESSDADPHVQSLKQMLSDVIEEYHNLFQNILVNKGF